mgnify:CR=1
MGAVDYDKAFCGEIPVYDWLDVGSEDLETFEYRFSVVVRAMLEPLAAHVTYARGGRRAGGGMVDRAAAGTGEAMRYPLYYQVIGHIDEYAPAGPVLFVEFLSLVDCTGEAVEDESLIVSLPFYIAENDLGDEFLRADLSAQYVFLDLYAEGCLLPDLVAKDSPA